MTHKTHDLAVKVGTYTDRSGNEKGRWQNVGSVLETTDGGRVILLNRTFNPAGVPNPDGRDTVMLSMFEPKERDQPQPAADRWAAQQPQQQAPATQPDPRQQAPVPQGGFDDRDVPFGPYLRGTVA